MVSKLVQIIAAVIAVIIAIILIVVIALIASHGHKSDLATTVDGATTKSVKTTQPNEITTTINSTTSMATTTTSTTTITATVSTTSSSTTTTSAPEAEIVEIKVESELKITSSPWNESLSDPSSDMFAEMKADIEEKMDKAFCNKTDTTVSHGNDSCHTEVTGFSEGSINVFFFIIRIELKQFLPTVADILADIQLALVVNSGIDGTIGEFEIDEESVKINDIHTDKNVIIAANENGTEWKPTPKNETEDYQEGSGVTEEDVAVTWNCPVPDKYYVGYDLFTSQIVGGWDKCGLSCNQNGSACKYWTWIPGSKGGNPTCHFKYEGPGVVGLATYVGAYTGDRDCTAATGEHGSGSDEYGSGADENGSGSTEDGSGSDTDGSGSNTDGSVSNTDGSGSNIDGSGSNTDGSGSNGNGSGSNEGTTTIATTTTELEMTTTTTPSRTQKKCKPQHFNNHIHPDFDWHGSHICHSTYNSQKCIYDGGDCCLAVIDDRFCPPPPSTACDCHEDGTRHPSFRQEYGVECPFWNYLKDGTNAKCNDELNIELCNYDGGACCKEVIDDSECEFCLCHEDLTRHPSMFGTETPDPYEDDIPIPFFDREKCLRRGGSFTDGTYKDGLCHGMNNIYECDFDGGDCCLPVTYHSFCDTNLQTCNCHLMGMMAPGLIGHSQMEDHKCVTENGISSNIRTPYKYEMLYYPNFGPDEILSNGVIRNLHPDGCYGLQSEWYCGYARGFNVSYLLDNPGFADNTSEIYKGEKLMECAELLRDLENLPPMDESETCAVLEKKGNGICDGDANIGGACEFDGGDCCQPIIDNSGCVNETCLCYDDWSLHFNLADLPNCDVVNPSSLGDRICQDENNIEGCFHDFGDCCLMTIDDSECTDCLCIQFGVKMDETKFKENFEVSYSREEIATKDSKYFDAFKLHTSLLWLSGRREGLTTQARILTRELLSENVIKGMMSGYTVPFASMGDEKVISLGCVDHSPDQSSESKLYGDTGLCKRGLTVTAIGNGICNGHLNVPAYGFDFGDCCLPELHAPTQCDPFDSCACNEDETFHPLAYSAKDILDNCDANMEIVGNGVCDDEANVVGCGYDRGAATISDCCLTVIDDSACTDCICHEDNTRHEGLSTMTCDCKLWMDHAYNGECDDVLNNEECFWDNGDCCRYPRFLGDCENCTCHEDPFKALFGQLYFGEMDNKMGDERDNTAIEIAASTCQVPGGHLTADPKACCSMGHMIPSKCKKPPAETCRYLCEHDQYGKCTSCDECPSTTANPCLTTTTAAAFDLSALLGKRKKRDLGAMLAGGLGGLLGGGGGATTADPCGLGGDGDLGGLLGGLGGGGATTTAVNPFGGLGCLGDGLGGGDPNCPPCNCEDLPTTTASFDLGGLGGLGGGGGTTTTAATTSLDFGSLFGKRKKRDLGALLGGLGGGGGTTATTTTANPFGGLACLGGGTTTTAATTTDGGTTSFDMGGLGGTTTTAATTSLDFASLFGKRKKRDLGALLGGLGGDGGTTTTTANPLGGLGGLGGLLGGGVGTTTANPCGLGGDGGDYGSLLGGLEGGDSNCPCNCGTTTTTDGVTTSFNMGGLGGTTTTAATTSLDFSSLFGKRKKRDLGALFG